MFSTKRTYPKKMYAIAILLLLSIAVAFVGYYDNNNRLEPTQNLLSRVVGQMQEAADARGISITPETVTMASGYGVIMANAGLSSLSETSVEQLKHGADVGLLFLESIDSHVDGGSDGRFAVPDGFYLVNVTLSSNERGIARLIDRNGTAVGEFDIFAEFVAGPPCPTGIPCTSFEIELQTEMGVGCPDWVFTPPEFTLNKLTGCLAIDVGGLP